MPYCAAFGCQNKQFKGSGLSFFGFPKDCIRRKAWIFYCKRKDWTPTPYSTLCSVHFSPSNYETFPATKESYGYRNARAKLFVTAIPDVHLLLAPEEPKTPKTSRGAYAKRRRAEVLQEINIETYASESNLDGGNKKTPLPKDAPAVCDTFVQSPSVLCEDPVPDLNAIPKWNPTVKRQQEQKLVNKPQQRTRRIQVKPKIKDFCVQHCPTTVSVGIQCDLLKPDNDQIHADKCSDLEDSGDDDDDSDDDSDDPDYVPLFDESCEDDSEFDEEEPDIQSYILNSNSLPNDERQYLIAENALADLMSVCRLCSGICTATVKNQIGFMVTVTQECANGHCYTWQSQKNYKKLPWANLFISGGILFSGSSPSNVITLFNHMKIPCISVRTYYRIQSCYLIPCIEKCWAKYQNDLMTTLSGADLSLGGDARCDSPGHCAKYGSYTLMDLERKLVLDVQLVQVNEVKNSQNMELEGLKRSLEHIKKFGCHALELVTDRHVQVKKYMREKEGQTRHYFDVWHMAKGVKKKLEAASKKKRCEDIIPWIHSISNHMYWVSGTSSDDKDMKLAKWRSVSNHVINVHTGHGAKFAACEHETCNTERVWLTAGSRSHKLVKAIINSPYLLKDIPHLSPLHQTSSLEVYHNVVNHFAPKSTHFFISAMKARLHLAAFHYN
ncbi:uncharacterized protein LOC121379739, partial [Gigantopelta aegis]